MTKTGYEPNTPIPEPKLCGIGHAGGCCIYPSAGAAGICCEARTEVGRFLEIVAGLLRSIRPGITRIMFSGRMAGDRRGDWHRYWLMKSWLAKNNLPIDHLLMRPGGDQRTDSIIKNEMLDAILPYYDVVFAVDDRPQVCDGVWRARGIPLLQVVDPDIPPRFLEGT